MNRYDLIFIIQSDVPKDEVDDVIERYKGIVANLKGTIVKTEKWGIRRLAYKIQKQGRGFYVLLDFVGSSPVIKELERNLKFDDKVLRYQTVKRAENISLAEIEKEMARREKPEEVKEASPPAKPEAQAGAQPEAPTGAQAPQQAETAAEGAEGVNKEAATETAAEPEASEETASGAGKGGQE